MTFCASHGPCNICAQCLRSLIWSFSECTSNPRRLFIQLRAEGNRWAGKMSWQKYLLLGWVKIKLTKVNMKLVLQLSCSSAKDTVLRILGILLSTCKPLHIENIYWIQCHLLLTYNIPKIHVHPISGNRTPRHLKLLLQWKKRFLNLPLILYLHNPCNTIFIF